MYHSGIGGGGFMLVRSPNGTFEYVDFRETAPAAAFQDMYKNNTDASLYGGLARSATWHTPKKRISYHLTGLITVVSPAKFELSSICIHIMDLSHGQHC